MAAFASDREREILDAVASLATSNPFLGERIESERQALGERFVQYAPVWHVDGDLQGINPNIDPLQTVTEELAETLRARLASGVTASRELLLGYEGLIRHLLYYRYEGGLSDLIEQREAGRPATRPVEWYADFERDGRHFLGIEGVDWPFAFDPAHVLAWGFQIRRTFHHIYWQIHGSSMPIAELRGAVWRAIFTHDADRYRRGLFRYMDDIPVLILGESGTGKELVARAIGLSRYIPFDPERRAFVSDYADGYQAVNLSALSTSLIESELFGHKQGAFTGASADRSGWLEACGAYGAIFLDEIGDLDPAIQVKLLRVLQSRVFQRLGETEDRRFEGRFLAATNRDLDQEMRNGRFREDLYYRLCANVIETPPLRSQIASAPGELEQLVSTVSSRIAGDEAAGLSSEVMDWIRSRLPETYPWPGNVRELEQCVRSVMVHGKSAPPPRVGGADGADGADVSASLLAGEASADELLREYVTRVYARVGSYEGAARTLGLDRRTVKAKVDEALLSRLIGG